MTDSAGEALLAWKGGGEGSGKEGPADWAGEGGLRRACPSASPQGSAVCALLTLDTEPRTLDSSSLLQDGARLVPVLR